ncbi:Clarin-3 [Salmo salar]|uniref:Clarin-3 n=1 Tax=Salmo salar TaxID=8030 RepID=C0HAW8_SALSA|nr:Clarin-3 [Salmo salar]ACN11187.1 Clarin-3 [Salmo salar]|eukprot:NP_001167247.1 Clarin-3 [Salmo salar]
MPSTKKALHFIGSAQATAVSVAILGYGMSTEWAVSKMSCSKTGNDFTNGSAIVLYELFNGFITRGSCPVFGGYKPFQVFEKLAERGGAPQILHGIVITLLALCLLCSAGSILITLYNSVSNPYQTYMGPIGLYTCSSGSACISFLVLILYVVNVQLTEMSEDLVQNDVGRDLVYLKDKTSEFQVGYYLMIPYMVLSLLAILLVYLYEHAAYTHRQEQQRPTEDAPKEIMMY